MDNNSNNEINEYDAETFKLDLAKIDPKKLTLTALVEMIVSLEKLILYHKNLELIAKAEKRLVSDLKNSSQYLADKLQTPPYNCPPEYEARLDASQRIVKKLYDEVHRRESYDK